MRTGKNKNARKSLAGWVGFAMAERVGSPRMVGNLLISWDSLGQWIFRVAQNDRYRQVSLSEIRRKNRHSVPDWRMDLEPDRQELAFRRSGSWLCW